MGSGGDGGGDGGGGGGGEGCGGGGGDDGGGGGGDGGGGGGGGWGHGEGGRHGVCGGDDRRAVCSGIGGGGGVLEARGCDGTEGGNVAKRSSHVPATSQPATIAKEHPSSRRTM